MNKLVKHIRRWNIWRKNNLNCKLYKFLVLIGFIKSATFSYTLLPEEFIEFITDITMSEGGTIKDININKGGTEK